MKSSKKKLTVDSEIQQLQEEGEGEGGGEEEASSKEEKPEEEMEDDEEETQETQEPHEQEAPKLEEGYYEIEAIRRKRVRKGQLQYLIKWRGWSESANTWEPIDNLQTCSDLIEDFEERLLKSTRKRKRRHGGSSNVTIPIAKNRRSLSIELNTGKLNREEAELDGDGSGLRVEGEEANGLVTNVEKVDEPDGLVEDGSSKVECSQPLQGAKKRKSGCVRRFKQDDGKLQSKGEKLGSEDVDSTEDDNGERQKADEIGNPPYLTKILKPVKYLASVTNDEQQVSIQFKALRSDGQEVLVDDKDLKVNNPLLLIRFYEQHLRYTPDS